MAKQPTQAERVYVWEAPVRVAHWIHVLSILALAVSGYYIGSPFLAVESGTPGEIYVMASMRLTHAIAGIFLGASFILRTYWAFVGNRYARLQGLLPFTGRRFRDFWRQLAYYLFLSNKRPRYVGHNPVAGVSYVIIYFLVFVQGLTGLALYSEYYPGGFWDTFFGWAFRWLATNNVLRLVHHSIMWAFAVFFLVHLYLAVLDDLRDKDGVTSSILSGYKAVEHGGRE